MPREIEGQGVEAHAFEGDQQVLEDGTLETRIVQAEDDGRRGARALGPRLPGKGRALGKRRRSRMPEEDRHSVPANVFLGHADSVPRRSAARSECP